VVYGDIGTSPLYTLKEVFLPATGVSLNAVNLIGAVSAIFWALMIVVTLKYVFLVLRADNRGEGGVLALTALASRAVAGRPQLRAGLLLLGSMSWTPYLASPGTVAVLATSRPSASFIVHLARLKALFSIVASTSPSPPRTLALSKKIPSLTILQGRA
jgi:K+ transporter